MSKDLVNIKLDSTKLKDLIIGDGQATLVFEHDQIVLSDHHDQDCCENVYADWDTLELYKTQLDGTYVGFSVRGVEAEGMLLCFEKGPYSSPDKVFIPCYDEQNGYYNNALKLNVTHANKTTTVDITEYEESIDG